MNAAALAALAAAVLAPLGREYAEFRTAWGLGRLAALATTLLVVPSVAAGLAVSLPLAGQPPARWAVAGAVALLVYSLAVRAAEAVTDPAR